MYYVVDSTKSFDAAAKDLEAAVERHGFGVLHVHDMGAILRSKGIKFTNECKVFEICNPKQAEKVLATDLRLNMALPCRISVYTERGHTRIGLVRPSDILSSLSDDRKLRDVAEEVEEATIAMVEEAK